jgi:hypothetical protein
MPKKGFKPSYKPKIEYRYTVKDVAEAAGITRNALGVAKARGKVDPADFRSMVSFLIRVIIERRLRGNLFAHAVGVNRRVKKGGGVIRSRARKPKRLLGANRGYFLKGRFDKFSQKA